MGDRAGLTVRALRICLLAGGLLIAAGRASATGPPLIFFASGSSGFSPQAKAMLDYTADWLRENHATAISIEASTDRVGSAASNRRLSRRRGEAVKAALVRRGIPAETITVKAFGETRPLVDTADGVAESQNRYAMIFIEKMEDR